ncbi:MAG: hypothetical protein RIR95_711 [Pseudomonadota bacterium]
MKTERRWIKSVIATSNEAQVVMPWQRGTRRRPAAFAAKSAKAPAAARLAS